MDTKNKINSSARTVFITLAIICLFVSGCGKTFYKAAAVYKVKPGKDQSKRIYKVLAPPVKQLKYIVVHQDTSLWLLKDAVLDRASKSLSGKFQRLDAEYASYHAFETRVEDRAEAYFREEEEKKYAAGQLHIYLDKDFAIPYDQEGKEAIPFSGITMIKDFQLDVGRNKNAHVLPVFLGIVGGTATLLVGAVVVLCNCPYVYASNGTGFNFSGTMFTGALYKNLERDDYMPLSSARLAEGIELKVVNVKKEQQFTNLAEIMVAEHPQDLHVLTDKQGLLHTYRIPVAPVSAVSAERFDHTREVAGKDHSFFSFNDDQDKEPLNDIVLSFIRPAGALSGKLILNVKNTEWSGFTYDRICRLLGEKYGEWTKSQSAKSREELVSAALKQGGPLAVYMKTGTGWEYVDFVNVVGALAARDVLVPLDLSKISSDTVSIRLKCAFMFWDLDYAGMDFTKDEPVKLTVLKPSYALDSMGVDHKAELMADDASYLQHYNTKDYVVIKFDTMQTQKEMVQTVFLHSKGYYSRTDTYEGKPQYKALLRIRRPGGFSVFSKEQYYRLLSNMAATNKTVNGN
ncbi:MAG: hypothetical protein JWO09_3236 [Bacteroidetes bacterium]|nr:hypothetical protein [Bacteroidota bacterium]